MPWVYEESTHNYRDDDTGRFVSAEEVIVLSALHLDRTLPVATQLAQLLADDRLNLRDWEVLMREEIKAVYIQQYLLGRGGLHEMTPQDWGSIGGMLAKQYRYLSRFSRDVAAGNLTEAQIAVRAQMYFNSARQAFERARGRAQGWDVLPAYAGDGTTFCLTNCRCHWRQVGPHEYIWVLDPIADHCTGPGEDGRGRPFGCVERAAKWNPYVVG